MKLTQFLLLGTVSVTLLCHCGGSEKQAEAPRDHLSESLETLTGAHTRVVWCQHETKGEADPFAIGEKLILRGLDTRDGKGDRQLLSTTANYSRPLLSSDGEVIVFTDKAMQREGEMKHYEPAIYRTDWVGSEPKRLTEGYAVDCWRDPATNIEWVYAVEDLASGKGLALVAKRLVRFPLNAPQQKEVMYDETQLSPDNIQLSRSGTQASGMAPWPRSGVLAMDGLGPAFTDRGFGCWTSAAPDESGLMWVFDGSHREVVVYAEDGKETWRLKINGAPGMKDSEVYHPRWSNHARFIAVTGPYRKTYKSKPGSVINQGGATAEVFVGRLSPDAREIDGWVQITRSKRGDAYPDVWIAGGEKANLLTDQHKAEVPCEPAS